MDAALVHEDDARADVAGELHFVRADCMFESNSAQNNCRFYVPRSPPIACRR
jgi:hypothetical protein